VLKLNGGEHEGRPFELHESQAFIVGSLFGWLRSDGTRRFRVAFIEQGKGNGKSPLAAGVGHYMTGADGESRAETYAAATDKDQAGILFRDAVAMAKQSDAIMSRVTFSGGVGKEYNIAYLGSGSFFRPISSESRGRGKSGFRPHCALLDEIHEHPTNAMVEFMRAGTKGRAQPLIFMITNSGVDRTSVCFEYHTYATRVASGELQDDSFFAYVCALDDDEDPFTDKADPDLGYPRSWLKANPLLGVTFKPSYLEEQVRQAKGMPAKESIVRRLNFCQWVDAENPWISGEAWRSCERDWLDPSSVGVPCYLALDLSGKRDLTALAQVWPDDDGSLDAQVEFWTPGDTLLHRASVDRAPYDVWERDGFLHAPSGKSIDYAYVAGRVAEIHRRPGIVALAFDPYRMDDFTRALDDVGVPWWIGERKADRSGKMAWVDEDSGKPGEGIMLVRHGQGFGGGQSDSSLWMPRSITTTEDAILGSRLRVQKNPVLTWNAASAVLAQDAQENRKWEKRKSTGRIDGIVALSMAVGLADALRDHVSESGSVYETRGIRSA
jgi:phage terminase large subunit-like protein